LSNGRVLIDIMMTGLDHPMGWIAPSSQVGKTFDSETAQEQKYAHMGTGIKPRDDTINDFTEATLGAAAVDGRYFR